MTAMLSYVVVVWLIMAIFILGNVILRYCGSVDLIFVAKFEFRNNLK